MVMVCSKQAGINLKSENPKFDYKFNEADSPIDIKEEHLDKVLSNPNFYKHKNLNKKKSNK